jgi:monoamine oxidase
VVEIADTEAMLTKAQTIMDDFFGIDGHDTRSLMPYPHDPLRPDVSQPWREYDHLSIKDRLDQLAVDGKHSQEDLDLFETIAVGPGVARSRDIGFVEFLRWTALSGHTLAANLEATGTFKIGNGGTTRLARKILDDYHGDILMSATVTTITNSSSGNVVKLLSGKAQHTKAIVCTIPL